jgi:precorrin-2 dehydrogenase / sirohydrochlorin ferrochelatase
MTAFGYPVFLELTGRRCVVIGENAVRERKAEGLLAAGATSVVVLAERPVARLDELEALDGVEVARRPWSPADLDGAFLIVGSSEDAGERDAIAREARARGALVNVMDDVPNCDWAAPAIVRRGDLALAISTGGASPALARRVREDLAERYGEHWAELVDVLREVRAETLSHLPDLAERARRWRLALDLDEAEKLILAGRRGELADRLRARLIGGSA